MGRQFGLGPRDCGDCRRRDFVAQCSVLTRREILAASASSALSSSTAWAQGRKAKPNIIYIMADDLGYADLSCYGRREYRTSKIDSIASNGMKFLQAYAN